MAESPHEIPLRRGAARPTPLQRGVPRVGVVLAAGRSERLRKVTGGGSKALVRLAGVSLVERAVRGLQRAGVQRVVVVMGYHAGPVGAVVGRIGGVRTILAESWELGNGRSLQAAEEAVRGEETFALVTTDHVFATGALDELLHAGEPAVLVDPRPDAPTWAEGCKVRMQDGAVVAFGKELIEPAIDCGAFLLPTAVFEAQRHAAAEGDHSLAEAVSRLAAERPMRAVRIHPRAWWQDVDTPEDLALARRRLRRSLGKPQDGPVSRLLNRPVSTRISLALSPLRLRPSVVSFLVAALGGVAAWLLARGRAPEGGLVAHAVSVLDGVDGELARLQLRDGPRGAMLDGVLDRLIDAALLGGLGVWALTAGTAPATVVGLVTAGLSVTMLSMATKDRAAALGLPSGPERLIGWLLAGRDGRLLIVAAGGVLGRPALALAAVAITGGLGVLLRVGSSLRRSRG